MHQTEQRASQGSKGSRVIVHWWYVATEQRQIRAESPCVREDQ